MRIYAIAAILAALSSQPPTDENALRLSNVDIHLTKIGYGPRFRVQAVISNPNAFLFLILSRAATSEIGAATS
jgi:hypothetical protein